MWLLFVKRLFKEYALLSTVGYHMKPQNGMDICNFIKNFKLHSLLRPFSWMMAPEARK